jgi:hypothetical protein
MSVPVDLNKIDLSKLQDLYTQPAPVKPLSGKARAGVYLTWGVLGLIFIYLVVFFVLVNVNRIDASDFLVKNYSSLMDTTHVEQSKILIQNISNEAKSYREFWLGTNQMILLNLLFPILTALLGYIFGSREDKR